MSTSPFAFTTFDGTDDNGVRAEVYVQSNKGTIKEVKENTARGVADVYFLVERLNYPIHGWIRTDEPVYKLVIDAKNFNKEVSFRIETQRKSNVDRSTPMAELRVDMASAKQNVKVILVGIDSVLSGEAVTNPNEDPKSTGGRYVATSDDLKTGNGSASSTVSESSSTFVADLLQKLKTAASNSQIRSTILEAFAAQVLAAGATVDEVNEALTGNDKRVPSTSVPEIRASFSQEAPAWKEYNSDGRLNLGSAVISGGVGIENLVYKQLSVQNLLNTNNVTEVTEYFVDLVFTISDRVQVATYGEGFRADRGATSHARIRGIVYDTIGKQYALPLVEKDNNIIVNGDKAVLNNWIASVGKEVLSRFAKAIRSSQNVKTFSQLSIPVTLFGETPTPAETVKTAETVETAEIDNQVTLPTSIVEAVEEVETTSTQAPTAVVTPQESLVVETAEPTLTEVVEASQGVTGDTEADVTLSGDVEYLGDLNDVEKANLPLQGVLLPRLLKADEVANAELSTSETRSTLQDLFNDSGFDITDKADLVRISHLLTWTFGKGYGNAKAIPEEDLIEFIDWYVANGSEAIFAAVAAATGRG